MARTIDEMLQKEKPEVAKARAKADKILLEIHLTEIRERVQKTQGEIAKALSVKQPIIAEMEKPGRDIKLSSLKRYVEASGGKLRVDIELPDGTHFGFPV